MAVESLDELTHAEIVLSMLLLKPGSREFLRTDLEAGLARAGKEEPSLAMHPHSITNTFFFYEKFLNQDGVSRHYGLAGYARDVFRAEFDTYSPSLQQRLREIADIVWRYKTG